MKKQSFVLFLLGTLLFTGSVVSAQTPGLTPKFGEEARELREQNQAERKNLIEGNQAAREKLRLENKGARTNLLEENKNERETLRNESKDLLKGKTPEEKLTLIPTIKAERKDLMGKNKAEAQAFRIARWDSKKSLNENIRTNMDGFRETVRSRWTSLWGSFFGKK